MDDGPHSPTPGRFRAWAERVQPIGHPQFPFLAADYKPQRRIPCRGFVEWIADAFLADDPLSIAKLFCEIVRANPGISPGGESDLMGTFGGIPYDLRSLDVGGAISGLSVEQVGALLSAYVLQAAIEGYQEEFILIHPGRYLMAASILPWDFRIPVAEECVRNANTFIKGMRKDTVFWNYEPLYGVKRLASFDTDKQQALGCIMDRLVPLTVSARMHLLDTVKDTLDPVRGTKAGVARRPLENCVSADTRNFGCYVKDTSQEVRASGLVRTEVDPALFQSWFTRNELQDLLRRRGVVFKRPARHAELYSIAAQAANEDLQSVLKEKGAFLLCDDLVRLGDTLLSFYNHQASRLGAWAAGWRVPRVRSIRKSRLLAKGIVEVGMSEVGGNRGA